MIVYFDGGYRICVKDNSKYGEVCGQLEKEEGTLETKL